jgi:hypothetical protein
MSDVAIKAQPAAAIGPRRIWLVLTTIGCTLITLALIVVALVLPDKAHFGWLVGSLFLEVVSSGVIVGSLVLLVGAWNLPGRKRWRGITLLAWGLVALTSPLFGILFLLPWGLLVLLLPVVWMIVIGFFRGTPAE